MKMTTELSNYTVSQIKNLCRIPSPTGFTRDVVDYLQRELTDLGYQPELTNKKAVLVDLGGEGDPLVLTAHVDTLGAMVRAIKCNGRLRLTRIGGFPENNIEGENCTIHSRLTGKTFSGTIQLTHASVHVYRDVNELKRSDETVEVVIDENVNSEEGVKALGIRVGDFISFDPRVVVTDSGYIKSRHLDDKASAGILLALAKWLKDEAIQLPRKVYLLFSTYEEVGHGGAASIPAGTTEFIAVDMGAMGDDLTTTEHTVSICPKDSSGPYDYGITSTLIQLAEKLNLSYAVDIYPYYGSDASVAVSAGYDVRHGLIGPGVSASHGYERTHRQGVEDTLRLLAAYVTNPST